MASELVSMDGLSLSTHFLKISAVSMIEMTKKMPI